MEQALFDLCVALAHGRRLTPLDFPFNGFTEFNLCYTHPFRKALNRALMTAFLVEDDKKVVV